MAQVDGFEMSTVGVYSTSEMRDLAPMNMLGTSCTSPEQWVREFTIEVAPGWHVFAWDAQWVRRLAAVAKRGG